jgi:hypothetical protein
VRRKGNVIPLVDFWVSGPKARSCIEGFEYVSKTILDTDEEYSTLKTTMVVTMMGI